MICHYWYFKYIGYEFDPYVSNGCHHISMMTRIRKHCNASNGFQDISMMIYQLENIAILFLKVVYYRYILWNQYAK